MSHDNHNNHHVNYFVIFLVLCCCTAASVVFDVLHFSKPITIVLVLAVAVAKAMCVMMFFMHLKFEGNWKFVLLAPTTILAIGLPLALLPDIGLSYYTPVSPQHTSWKVEADAYREEHNAEHAAHGAVDDGGTADESVEGTPHKDG